MVECARCGHPNGDDHVFCSACGTRLEAAGSPAPARSPTGAAAGSETTRVGPVGPVTTQPEPAVEEPDGRPVAGPGSAPGLVGRDPAGIACWRCGQENDQADLACRRCGAVLAPPAAPTEPTDQAPARHRRSRLRWLAIALAVLGLLTAVVVGMLVLGSADRGLGPDPASRPRAHSNLRKVATAGARASSFFPRHPPGHAVDGDRGTYWAERRVGDGIGQYLTVTFAQPVDLAVLRVRSGAAGAEFALRTRPRDVRLELTTATGGAEERDYTLSDDPGAQDLQVGLAAVTRVRIVVVTVYPAGRGGRAHTSITEVEAFAGA